MQTALGRALTGAAAVALAAFAFPSVAAAAGFEVPDNGAAALGMGGAYAATAADPTAIYYNPAGLAWQPTGLSVFLGSNFTTHNVSFRRKESPYQFGCATEKGCQTTTADSVKGIQEVQNTGGTFPGPFVAVSYGLPLSDKSQVAFALGAYGPPAVGHYQYPAPNYTYDEDKSQFVDDARKSSPQRYNLIENNVLIAYPTLSAAYRFKEIVAVGASLQYVYFDTAFKQAITNALPDFFSNPDHPGCDTQKPGTCGPDRMRDEDPLYDALVDLHVTGSARKKVTGILGAKLKLGDRVSVGAAFRPGFTVVGDGTINISLSRFATQAGASLTGNGTQLTLNMPNQARLGVAVSLFEGLDAEVDGVFEGWSSVDKFTITPKDVMVKQPGSDPTPLAPIVVEKDFQNAYSVRLGLQYKLPVQLPVVKGIHVRAGGFYETSAVPEERTNIDFANWQRTGETVGFSVGLPFVEVQAAAAFVQQPTREVTDSKVLGVGSDPNLKPYVIGNGTFNASYTIFSAGLLGRF